MTDLRIRFSAVEGDTCSAAMRDWLDRKGLLAEGDANVAWIDEAHPRLTAPGDDLPLLLTRGATFHASYLVGCEEPALDVEDRAWRDAEDELCRHEFAETPRMRGHACYRRHPLFDGLHGGAFTWWPREGERRFALTWRAPAWPRTARVVAVERAHIHINAARATIWEYDEPRILCIGAYLPFDSSDPIFRANLERLILNALRHLSGPPAADPLYWRSPAVPRTATRDDRLTVPPSSAGSNAPLGITASPLRLAGGEPDAPFTIAGRRTLVAGTGSDGVREIWTHPLRVLADLRVGGATLVDWDVTPYAIERRLRIADTPVIERVFVPSDLPAAVVEWQSAKALEPDVRWTCDLRLMWPYDAGAQGSLRFNVYQGALVIENDDGERVAFEVRGALPEWTIEAIEPAPRIACGFRCAVPAGGVVRLRIAASPLDSEPLDRVLPMLREPAALSLSRAGGLRRLARDRFTFHAPDPKAREAVEWAKARLESYVADTPGVGRSLVAGHWTSRPGWNDGRPGYAWYFGRDAAWTALASLAVGDFDAARDTLSFLAAKQDPTGKILHECTTSGSVHYDAADSTPLFLLLAARHLAWTGELSFIAALWPHVRRALEFCMATTDDAGLIQNTRIGHGWIEFGRLGGGRVTYYNAGIWAAALRELARAAESIGARDEATMLKERATQARSALEQSFWSPQCQAYALRLDHQTPDLRLTTPDTVHTATHAVPLLLGVADADRAAGWLDLAASDEFTTPHGVRMCARSDPDYDPTSYHGGAVWPLYTGWVSWAEYAAARPDAGFRHWWSNVELAFSEAMGAWPEVLHGEEARSIGVTPDQAWSTAMAVAPLVNGLLGVEPDAPRNRIRLRPHPPLHWDRFTARCLRVGDARIDLDYRREDRRHIFRLELSGGAVPPRVVFEPALVGRLVHASLDGAPASLIPRAFGDRTLVPVQLELDGERTLVLEMES